MARVPRPPALDVETLLVRMGYFPNGPFGPNAAEEPYPRYRALHRAYDRRTGNFQAWGWVCQFSYYTYEADWGQVWVELEVALPDSEFEKFGQTTL